MSDQPISTMSRALSNSSLNFRSLVVCFK